MTESTITAPRPAGTPSSSARTAETLLTPSEAVLLHGDRFAKPDTIRTLGETLLLDDARKVDAEELAETALATAVLANVDAGGLRIELRTNRHLFGLVKTRSIVVQGREATPSWPAGSLEAAVLSRRPESGTRKMSDLLYDVLETDTAQPPLHALGLIKRGLAGRGLLDDEETKKLRVFTSIRQVPSATLRGADLAPHLQRAEELLAPWRERTEEWKYLLKAASEALGRRTEMDRDVDWD